MNIVLPDYVDLEDSAKKKIKDLGAKLYDDVPSEATIIERIKDAEVITANYIDITKAIIDAAPKLKYIVVPAVGYEWVDYKYAQTKGIKVLNCPTHNAQAVAEHAFALIFAVQRKIVPAVQELKDGKWNPKELKGVELAGTKLGLVGHGKIGQKIENIANAIGMDVAFVDSKSSSDGWNKLFETADVVCMILPLTDATRKIVGGDLINRMKKTAILINVGRGATIDAEALTNALKSKSIAGAGVDVYEDEPLSGDPPEQIVSIANLENIVATPHVAYNTRQTAQRLGEELVSCIESCLSGSPINVVN
jgi:phosphoglycerate dehydrogenase-like enzyme